MVYETFKLSLKDEQQSLSQKYFLTLKNQMLPPSEDDKEATIFAKWEPHPKDSMFVGLGHQQAMGSQ